MPNILVAHHSDTNHTAAFAAILCAAAAAQSSVTARCKPIGEVKCEDLTWMHGVAFGSPVYWGGMSGTMKLFLDQVQTRCFEWPVHALRWRAGAGFTTGAHLASGKETAIRQFHTFYHSVQMVPVGNEPPAACLLGACATVRDGREPTFTDAEKADAHTLATRLATLASALQPLISDQSESESVSELDSP